MGLCLLSCLAASCFCAENNWLFAEYQHYNRLEPPARRDLVVRTTTLVRNLVSSSTALHNLQLSYAPQDAAQSPLQVE